LISRKHLKDIQIQSELANAKAREISRQKTEEAQRAKAATIQRDLYEREQKSAELKRLADKENAWKSYYEPISGCESNNPNRETIKCGNDYLKAKKEFEAEWLKKQPVLTVK